MTNDPSVWAAGRHNNIEIMSFVIHDPDSATNDCEKVISYCLRCGGELLSTIYSNRVLIRD
jgi:hypothetical protein